MVVGKKEFVMLNESGMIAFEQSVRDTLEARRAAIGMSEQALGKLAFPFVADSRRKVQSIRKGQGSGENRKPQNLRLADVMNLCVALGLSWEKVVKKAEQDAETAQQEEYDRMKAILESQK